MCVRVQPTYMFVYVTCDPDLDLYLKRTMCESRPLFLICVSLYVLLSLSSRVLGHYRPK
jgi:hypothetical protein